MSQQPNSRFVSRGRPHAAPQKQEHALRTTFVITMIIAASKLLGFVREMVLAAYFGRGVESDAFVTAYGILSIMTLLFSAGISSTFIPIYTKTRFKQNQREADRYASRILTLYFITGVVGSLLAYIFAPFICRLIYRAEVGVALTIQLTRMMYPSLAFWAMTGVFCNLLNARERFVPEQLMGFVFSFSVIAAMVAFRDIRIVSIAVSASGLLQFLFILPFLRGQFHYTPQIAMRDPKIRRTFLLAMPAMVSMAFDEINHQVDRIIGSGLAVGVVTALSKSYALVTTALGVLIVPITTITFSRLSRMVANRNKHNFLEAVRQSMELIALITWPVILLCIIMQKEIIALAFQRGAFTAADTAFTAPVFAFYIAGIYFFGMRNFLSRVFYALQDTRTPMKNGIIAVGINIGIDLFITQFMGAKGLSFATTTAGFFGSTMLLMRLRRKVGPMGLKRVLIQMFRMLLALLGSVIVLYFVRMALPVHPGTLALLLRLGVNTLAFMGAYMALASLMHVRAMRQLLTMVRRR